MPIIRKNPSSTLGVHYFLSQYVGKPEEEAKAKSVHKARIETGHRSEREQSTIHTALV